MEQNFTIIDSSDALSAVCGQLEREEVVAIDTEFLRETTYWPVLCLVQVMGGSECAEPVIIDPLVKGLDFNPLRRLLTNPDVLKVMHAGSNDTEVLQVAISVEPAPVFDTQVAAEFCGFGANPSYATLVKQIAGSSIDKSSQFSNWSRRPLPPEQISYAAGDVLYLPTVYRTLMKKLERFHRIDWVKEETERRYREFLDSRDPREVWTKISGYSSERIALAILREVAAWREEEAICLDKPRQHVLRNQTLHRIVRMKPKHPDDLLMVIRGKTERHARMREKIVEAVRRGLECPPNRRPKPHLASKANGKEIAVAKLLASVLEGLAASEGVAPGIVADKSDLRRLASEDSPDVPLLSGWRRRLCGETLLGLRDGRLGLKIEDGKLVPITLEDGEREQ